MIHQWLRAIAAIDLPRQSDSKQVAFTPFVFDPMPHTSFARPDAGIMPRPAHDLSNLLQELYHESEGFTRASHPGFKRLAYLLSLHGKEMWEASVRSASAESLLLRSWLRDLATAPVREWAAFRLEIMPLIRAVGDPPRPCGQALLARGFEVEGEAR
jgi:hypothetical protein